MLNGIEPLCIISFTIPGPPKAWARANRVGKRMAKSVDQKKWAERIRNYFAVARNIHPRAHLITWPHDGPVCIEATGYFPIADSWDDWQKAAAWAYRLPCERYIDADNMIKAVMDALNKIAYTDDRRVFDIVAGKRWDLPEEARLEVEIHFYPEITESNYGL